MHLCNDIPLRSAGLEVTESRSTHKAITLLTQNSAIVGLASVLVFIPITALIGRLLVKANKEKKALVSLL